MILRCTYNTKPVIMKIFILSSLLSLSGFHLNPHSPEKKLHSGIEWLEKPEKSYPEFRSLRSLRVFRIFRIFEPRPSSKAPTIPKWLAVNEKKHPA